MHSLNRKYNHGPTLSKLHKIYQKRIKKNYKYILKGKTNISSHKASNPDGQNFHMLNKT